MKKFLFCIVLISFPAAAQQTPSEQALGAKVMQEMQSGMACSVALITAQQQIAELKKLLEEAKKADTPK